jgi:hypothetical protein
MRQIFETLITEASSVKESESIERDFPHFVTKLREIARDMTFRCQDIDMRKRLDSLAAYETYGELSRIAKIFRWVIAYKYHPNLIENWTHNGVYKNDLNWIIIKMQAILYRLN